MFMITLEIAIPILPILIFQRIYDMCNLNTGIANTRCLCTLEINVIVGLPWNILCSEYFLPWYFQDNEWNQSQLITDIFLNIEM